MKRVIVFLLLSAVVSAQEKPRTVLPQGGPGTVTLPLAEYDLLVERAARKPKPPEAAPLPFVLARSAFNLKLENDTVSGTLGLEGEVLNKGTTKVPLATDLTVLEAKQADKPLPLLREGATHTAVLAGPGGFSLSMSVAMAISIEAGRASFTIPAPATGHSLLALDIPGNHANIHVEPGLVTRRETLNGHTITEATLQPGKSTRVWWTTREDSAPIAQRESRFLSEVKTLMTVGDSEVRCAALCDLTVLQGEPAEFKIALPAGFEVSDTSGSTLISSEVKSDTLILKVSEPARRSHQFLIVLERSSQEHKVEAPLVGLAESQRETGEVLIEGVGAMDLTATEGGGVRRIDVQEASPVFRSLARHPLQAAFRYHRRPGDPPKLALEWTQFPDSSVLSAIAERATITTLLNVEGKTLTEVTLRIRNNAQPFMKVELPQGASLLSAEVEGEKVKPVLGPDGSRVPLLRTGFRPAGPYSVSFVILSSGTAFGKSGAYELGLPKLDVPISLLNWELFVPDRLEAKQFGGNAISASLFASAAQASLAGSFAEADDEEAGVGGWEQSGVDITSLQAGQIGGIVVDAAGSVVSGARVTVTNAATGATRSTIADSEGRWVVSGLSSGPVRVRVDAQGFKAQERQLDFNESRSALVGSTLDVGMAAETVTVTSDAGEIEREGRRIQQELRKNFEARINAPSQNVVNFQRKVAGILPVRVDVPRAGKSYRFVRPLVLEEETKVTFRYKLR